ncbi:1,2-phenylacetyl-CoA epoxidase subunit PaaC [Microterricola viridarii]|uniref:Ring-1,2-phenylacetyl-CoA epoxidase subunit PaaC n=1 Tax=Microterricola viridarii TaxID=412690 RepID=A0A1H1RGT8_9MICO|nr:1,2-phenylacetyl-CoA epoxidase subunit PaaC [Microterricola viridarii]SDS34129.1 ring-1,2-phenylacetyl-CoA epoxidase subunit PaaC [Microterricola viridarii]
MSGHSNRPISTAITPESISLTLSDADAAASDAVARYALGLGDDALVLAQRLGEWVTNAPELEEDVALANIALDQLGHARNLLTYAGSAWGQSEDDLAYLRGEAEFTNRQLFEQPNGDFAQTIARQLIASAYFIGLYRALSASADPTLSAIAAKALKEVDYHLDHSAQWLLRLGQGTAESHRRMQRGLERMWVFADELFDDDSVPGELAGIAVSPSALREDAYALLTRLITEAGLTVPTAPFARGGGRSGAHTEYLGPLLAEMQVLARAHPGASW